MKVEELIEKLREYHGDMWIRAEVKGNCINCNESDAVNSEEIVRIESSFGEVVITIE